MDKLKILIFNWRCWLNPEAGGAEFFTREVARRWAEQGHKVTLFSSEFHGCKMEEILDGIKVVRAGGQFGVYWNAKKYYKNRFSKEGYDVIVDEINTMPFFTPRFVNNGERIVCLIHQLAREFWFYETPFPISLVGYYILENRWLKNYVNVPAVTVSDSSERDLKDLGFDKIFIVHNGLNVEPVSDIPEKSERPSIVFVGRMKKIKRPGDVVEAFRIVNKKISGSELWIIGDGYLRGSLESKADSGVRFFGHADDETRNDLVRRAWVIAVPSVREGWGQVVTDANALGTPAVGYNVPGLKDSIRDGFNGLLVECSPRALADGIMKVLSDEVLREDLSRNAIKWSRQFSWDRCAEQFLKILTGVVSEQ